MHKLCDDVTELFTSWNAVFSKARKPSPTPDDVKELKEKIKIAVRVHRSAGLSITPKVHIVEDHLAEQYANIPGGIAYLLEDFVEHNHQIVHRQDEQMKRIVDEQTRAECKAKRKHIDHNPKVQQQIQSVKQKTSHARNLKL